MLDYRHCTLCPRRCGVDRTAGQLGFCRMPDQIHAARAALHYWEEPVISGSYGSGAVFFSGCTLRCAFCQNGVISQENFGKPLSPAGLRAVFERLIDEGCQNINLVTPTHFLPSILPALTPKLPVPVVYNCGGYESVHTVRFLRNKIQIWLPDMKYSDSAAAARYSHAPDYFDRAAEAIEQMYRQTGDYDIGPDGLLRKGVLIRHLILPGHTRNSIACLGRIREEFPGIPVSLMAQYTPCGDLSPFPELQRAITRREQEKVENALFELGLEGYTQSRKAKGAQYVPDWDMGE